VADLIQITGNRRVLNLAICSRGAAEGSIFSHNLAARFLERNVF
ncbi:uncharacterized protein METZ01_LOCUS214696, partial [marine metagenome]